MTPSVKDIEHIDRDAASTTSKISEPSLKRPTNWTVTIKNSSFKKLLIEFLVKSWKDDSLARFFNGKILYATSKTKCCNVESKDDKVLYTEQVNYCNNEEADSLMFYHLSLVPTPNNVVMRTNDNDTLLIAIRCLSSFMANCGLKVETSKKTQSGTLLLIRHVKNVVHHYAMRYQVFMLLQGVTLQCHLKGNGKLHLLSS